MQADYKVLSRLLGIKPDEIPFRFKKGKPLFNGELYELEANLDSLNEKIAETLPSLRDSMVKQSIANHFAIFLKKQKEAVLEFYRKRG